MASKDPDEGMVRDGEGDITVRVCPKERRPYHLGVDGKRIWHGVPEGFEYDAAGVLREVTNVSSS